jgi:protein transport protein SEC23
MDQAQYDAIKDNWAEVEDRDGVRLSWNIIPSTRMVCSLSGAHKT